MKVKNNREKFFKQGLKKSNLVQKRIIPESNQIPKTMIINNKRNLKKNIISKSINKSKTPKINNTKKVNKESSFAKESKKRPSVNINFKEIPKDISKEIPESLLCNICKNLVKNPSKCYQCKALFCRECLLNILEKNHKCPKCFKIISENLIRNERLENEFKNTFIKCKHIGCQESINLLNYQEHIKMCPFKNIKDIIEIDNLIYFDSLPFNEDPYSNSGLMNYSIKKAKNDFKISDEVSYIKTKEQIEEEYNNLIQGKGNNSSGEIFNDIIQFGKQLEDDINFIDNKQKEINDIVKELQSKIILY